MNKNERMNINQRGNIKVGKAMFENTIMVSSREYKIAIEIRNRSIGSTTRFISDPIYVQRLDAS